MALPARFIEIALVYRGGKIEAMCSDVTVIEVALFQVRVDLQAHLIIRGVADTYSHSHYYLELQHWLTL